MKRRRNLCFSVPRAVMDDAMRVQRIIFRLCINTKRSIVIQMEKWKGLWYSNNLLGMWESLETAKVTCCLLAHFLQVPSKPVFFQSYVLAITERQVASTQSQTYVYIVILFLFRTRYYYQPPFPLHLSGYYGFPWTQTDYIWQDTNANLFSRLVARLFGFRNESLAAEPD